MFLARFICRSGRSADAVAELASMRELPVVVYCGHGPRAYIAGAALRRRGFRNIVYLAGHMKKWREMKLPLEVRNVRACFSGRVARGC